MLAPQPLDLTAYVTAPRLSVPAAVALGIALLAARPKPAPALVRRAATRLRGSVLELQQQWRRHMDAGQPLAVAPRAVDHRVDRAFRAMSMGLQAIMHLSPEAGPDVELAEAIHQRLFPDGLRFLNLPHPQQWAHCDRLLTTFDEDEALLVDVERLVHASILAEVRASTEAYGVVLGITAARPPIEPVSLSAPLDAVRSAIVAYALQIVALQSDDPTRLPAARKALAPIDQLRAAQARRGQGSTTAAGTEPAMVAEPDESVTPDTPVPELDDAPATSEAAMAAAG